MLALVACVCARTCVCECVCVCVCACVCACVIVCVCGCAVSEFLCLVSVCFVVGACGGEDRHVDYKPLVPCNMHAATHICADKPAILIGTEQN